VPVEQLTDLWSEPVKLEHRGPRTNRRPTYRKRPETLRFDPTRPCHPTWQL